MCGIAGCFSTQGGAHAEERAASVATMSRSLAHRGPDADGLWQSADHRAVLAHRRLSIIDLDPRSNQPMISPDGCHVLSYNGELYNYRGLREQLEKEGWVFRTQSDTEVVLAALATWETAALTRMDGMFALAYYNARKQTVLLARDRCGEKPLFYSRNKQGTLWFCSELKPLAKSLPERPTISAKSLCGYLLLRYVPPPDTIFDDIHQLEPGTWLECDRDGGIVRRRWYSFARDPRPGQVDVNEYVDAVEAALTDSIASRTLSDVPVGLFLSSGIDSSIVATLAARRLGLRYKAFCASFYGADHDESGHAGRLAAHLGLPFERIRIGDRELLATLPEFGRYLDEPNGDRSCVPVYVLSRYMREHVTVAISGDGGDELFAGYGRYGMTLPSPPVPALAVHRQVLSYHAHGLPVLPMQAVAAAMPEAFAAWVADFVDRNAVEFLAPATPPEQLLRAHDFHTYMHGAVLAKVDRMSMRHALEVRTPFFSPEVLRLSTLLPDELIRSGKLMKLTLRNILGRHVPPDLIFPGKIGFGMPASFIQRHAPIFLGLLERAHNAAESVTDLPGGVATKMKAVASGSINSLWAYIALGLWLEDTR